MNRVFLIGRLVRDPEIVKKDANLQVTKFTLVVNDYPSSNSNQKSNFIKCVGFNKIAETINKYLLKGNQILVEGRISTSTYEKDGIKRNNFDIIISKLTFLGNKNSNNNYQQKNNKKDNNSESLFKKEKNFHKEDDNKDNKEEDINFNEDINWGE